MAGFVDVLKRNAREALELQGAHAENMARMLQALREALAGRLESIAPGDSALDVWGLRRALAEAEGMIDAFEKRSMGLATNALNEAIDLSAEHLGSELEAAYKMFGGDKFGVSLDAAKVLADPKVQLVAEETQSSITKLGADYMQGVRRELFSAMRGGQTFRQAAKNVSASAGPFGDVGRDRAETVIRTETSNAYNVANQANQEAVAKDTPSARKIWLHVGSFRCDVCMPLHGTTREVDDTWTIKLGKKTRELMHPPAHPRCVCRSALITKHAEKAASKLSFLAPQDDE